MKEWKAAVYLVVIVVSVLLLSVGIIMENPYTFLIGFAGIIFLSCLTMSKDGDPEWRAKKLAAETKAHDHGW